MAGETREKKPNQDPSQGVVANEIKPWSFRSSSKYVTTKAPVPAPAPLQGTKEAPVKFPNDIKCPTTIVKEPLRPEFGARDR